MNQHEYDKRKHYYFKIAESVGLFNYHDQEEVAQELFLLDSQGYGYGIALRRRAIDYARKVHGDTRAGRRDSSKPKIVPMYSVSLKTPRPDFEQIWDRWNAFNSLSSAEQQFMWYYISGTGDNNAEQQRAWRIRTKLRALTAVV